MSYAGYKNSSDADQCVEGNCKNFDCKNQSPVCFCMYKCGDDYIGYSDCSGPITGGVFNPPCPPGTSSPSPISNIFKIENRCGKCKGLYSMEYGCMCNRQ